MTTEKITEYLDFDLRSDSDRDAALKRVAGPDILEGPATENAEKVFKRDAALIKGSLPYKLLRDKAMLAPSSSKKYTDREAHTESVAETADQLCDALGLGPASKALTHAIVLAHDVGHPPFSHEGERALNEKLEKFGLSWDHDTAALDLLLRDTGHGLAYNGLPLSAATVEGIAKRYHRIGATADGKHAKSPASLGDAITATDVPINLKGYNHIEGQIAAVADWIASTASDIDDMMAMENASPRMPGSPRNSTLFFDALCDAFPLAKEVREERVARERKESKELDEKSKELGSRRPTSKITRDERLPVFVRKFCERLKQRLIENVAQHANAQCQKYHDQIRHAGDVRDLPELIAAPSPEICTQLDSLKSFYQSNVYQRILDDHINTVHLMGTVFDDFATGVVEMPDGWGEKYKAIANMQGKDDYEIERDRALLAAQYITSNMSERDVWQHMQHHHPEEFKHLMDAANKVAIPLSPPASALHKRSVEKELQLLRNSGRLAIHVNEALHDLHRFSSKTWNDFDTPPDQIPEKLAQSTLMVSALPLLSMSLLPPGERSIKPYSIPAIKECAGTYGYLVDLRQEQELPPRVVGASTENMGSGDSPRKMFWQSTHWFLPASLSSAYTRHDGDQWLHDCGNTKGAELTNALLDKMDADYRNGRASAHCYYSNIPNFFYNNEIVVAASKEHVRAITISVCDEPFGDKVSLYAPLAKLSGALIGLQHLDQHPPIDLPVVFYHMGNTGLADSITAEDETGPKRGDITYLGQGRQELLNIALDAIKTMQRRTEENGLPIEKLDRLRNETQEVLGIALQTPLNEQRERVDKLKAQYAVSAGLGA